MPGTPAPRFQKSSFSGHGGCVEVAPLPNGLFALRDSKNPMQSAHVYTTVEWQAFVRGVKAGEFDFDVVPAE